MSSKRNGIDMRVKTELRIVGKLDLGEVLVKEGRKRGCERV